ncbi:MAG: hypothetical protein K2W33_00645, partial [Burkholderiales bacterium]|nr:hypothetical protein [Burkholderiales bacterium]
MSQLPFWTFARIALADTLASGVPPKSPLPEHAAATLDWLIRAHDATNRQGVSYGFSLRGGWLPAYRETTGYILSTFFRAAHTFARPDLAERALQMADWLVSVQNADGSFSNPKFGHEGIVFDTGQDLFGLVAAWEHTQAPTYMAAALKAGNWLVSVADVTGVWTQFEHMNTPHVYNTRTAWALLRLNQVAPNAEWVRVARANLDWAVGHQHASGFFDSNAFQVGDDPYTHNISYAICGLQESGWLLADATYVECARRCSDAALALMQPDGFIAGQITPAGQPAAHYSCLTGQCQLAIVWAKQYNLTGDNRYREASQRSLGYAMGRQRIHDAHDGIRGGMAGSYPVYGRYAPLSYPNWAAKFCLDAAMLQL